MGSKLIRTSFHVDMAKGELPFRVFHSTEGVRDKMFAVMSKLTADNDVYYKIIGVDASGVTVLQETTTTMETFFKVVKDFETTVQKVQPTFRLVQAHGNEFALTNHPLAKEGKLTKEAAAAMLAKMEMESFQNDPIDNLFSKENVSSNRLRKYM